MNTLKQKMSCPHCEEKTIQVIDVLKKPMLNSRYRCSNCYKYSTTSSTATLYLWILFLFNIHFLGFILNSYFDSIVKYFTFGFIICFVELAIFYVLNVKEVGKFKLVKFSSNEQDKISSTMIIVMLTVMILSLILQAFIF